MKDLIEIRKENTFMVQGVIDALDKDLDDYSEIQKQLLVAFVFGMIYAKGFIEKNSAEDIHALSIAMLMDSFSFSSEKASQASNFLISAASDPSFHNTVNAVIHRGIDGHEQWIKGKSTDLVKNIENVLSAIN